MNTNFEKVREIAKEIADKFFAGVISHHATTMGGFEEGVSVEFDPMSQEQKYCLLVRFIGGVLPKEFSEMLPKLREKAMAGGVHIYTGQRRASRC